MVKSFTTQKWLGKYSTKEFMFVKTQKWNTLASTTLIWRLIETEAVFKTRTNAISCLLNLLLMFVIIMTLELINLKRKDSSGMFSTHSDIVGTMTYWALLVLTWPNKFTKEFAINFTRFTWMISAVGMMASLIILSFLITQLPNSQFNRKLNFMALTQVSTDVITCFTLTYWLHFKNLTLLSQLIKGFLKY